MSKYERASVFRYVNSGHQQDSNVCVLVWLCKTKYRSKAKLCHTDTSSFLAHVKSENVYTEIADAEKRINSLNYEVNKYTTSHGNKKKCLNLWRMNWMEEQWEFVALRSRMYNYLTVKLS